MMKRFGLLLVLVGAFALASPVLAQSTNDTKPAASPLVRLLQSKGILTDAEVATVSQASSQSEADAQLAKLLLSKGLISQEEYNQTVVASMQQVAADSSNGARMVPAVLRVPTGLSPGVAEPPASAPAGNASSSGVSAGKKMADILPGGTEATTDIAFGTIAPAPAAPEPAAAPAVIPAFAPVRVLPVGLMTRESVKPIIAAGPIHIQPYGFFKANVIEDSSMPTGGDAPLSGMLVTNTGPNPNPEFHLNARASRFGANFEWLDANEKLVVTGKIEGDFEGNFTHSQNRNVSSVRSSTFGLRTAFGRLDYHATDHSGIFAEFGQDWTPFCSSTLPSSNETTLLGVEFGSCYERQMMFRSGVNHDFGGARHFQIQPEFAIAYPALGQGADTVLGAISGQLSIGERQGADSNRPEYQSRIALQFQLDKAPGVAPAQLIVSGLYGKSKQLVTSTAAAAAGFGADFPGGASTTFRTYGYSAEAQLPTRWFTLQGKWWAGAALRWFFVNNLLNSFNPTAAFLAANPGGVVSAAVTSISAEGTGVVFGCRVALVGGACPAGSGVVLPQQPIRGVGGFGDLGIPLSRIFGANPTGRNAGWTLDFGYNFDQSKARDLRQNFGATGGRYKNDWGRVTLNYKLNSWVLFGFEESYYRTRAIPGPAGGLPLVIDGLAVRSWHDFHEQISTVFFF